MSLRPLESAQGRHCALPHPPAVGHGPFAGGRRLRGQSRRDGARRRASARRAAAPDGWTVQALFRAKSAGALFTNPFLLRAL